MPRVATDNPQAQKARCAAVIHVSFIGNSGFIPAIKYFEVPLTRILGCIELFNGDGLGDVKLRSSSGDRNTQLNARGIFGYSFIMHLFKWRFPTGAGK